MSASNDNPIGEAASDVQQTGDSIDDRLEHFAERFDKVVASARVLMEGDERLPTGRFDQLTLGVTFSGFSEAYLEKISTVLAKIQSELGSTPQTMVSISDIVNRYPDYFYVLVGQEVTAHEFFHFFQTLTAGSSHEVYKASREIAYLRIMIFMIHLRLGGKFDLNDRSTFSLFLILKQMPQGRDRSLLESLFSAYESKLEVIEMFFGLNEHEPLKAIDVFESGAFAFQKLLPRSHEVTTFEPAEDSRYKKARNYFAEKGGTDDVVFLVFCHLSLQYGKLDSGGLRGMRPTPQAIFSHLCEVNSLVRREVDVHIPDILAVEGWMVPTFEAITAFNHAGLKLTSAQIDFVESLSLEKQQLTLLARALGIYRTAVVAVGEYLKREGVETFGADFRISDERAKATADSIAGRFPLFTDELFFLALVVVPSLGQDFALEDPEQYLRASSYEGWFDGEITAAQEDAACGVLNDIDALLHGPIAYCCAEHPVAGYSTIRLCNNDESLRKRADDIFGIDLDHIFA